MEAVAKQTVRPHYFVCNADESEPGTFKDRVMMEDDPFAVIEALTIAGYATASEEGFLYIRGEYPLAHERIRAAIEECRTRGLLGDDVMGEGFRFDIELRRGAGAYICGEETALFNSIEGKRGEPRNKPPFPVERGLFDKPTGINNVETLLNVLEILRIGGPAFAQIGTPDSTGTRLFCLSGCVERPGLYEVEMGTTLRDLLAMAGGVRDGRRSRPFCWAARPESFVTADDLDLISVEDARAACITQLRRRDGLRQHRGSCRHPAAHRGFFATSRTGQDSYRVGAVRQEEAIGRLASGGRAARARRDGLLGGIAQVMKDASICGRPGCWRRAVGHRRLGAFGGAVTT